MAKVVQKLLSNAQDLEIYLCVEGKLGRDKVTRAAMARKYNVKPGVAESGYKRGKKLYESGERPDAKKVEHANNVEAIEGDQQVGIELILVGTKFSIPGSMSGTVPEYIAYGIDRDCGTVLVDTANEESIEIDSVTIIGEDSEVTNAFAAMQRMSTYPNEVFKFKELKFMGETNQMDVVELMGEIQDEDGNYHSLATINTDGAFATSIKNQFQGFEGNIETIGDEELRKEEKQTKAEKAKSINDTDLSEVKDLPTIVNTTMALIVKDGTNHQIPASHPNFEKVVKLIQGRDWDKAIEMMSIPKALSSLTMGRINVDRGTITFDGEPLEHDGFSKRIIAMMEEGEHDNLEYLIKFLDKTMDNPSNKIVRRIFDFMKFNDVRIAEDGDIMVFKAVDSNYKDCHSKKVDNSVGAVVKMRRNRVNENDKETCSYGLHVCALSYLPSYAGSNGVGNRIMKCKLNPADIVSVPTDYKDAKIRCCKYVVIEDITKAYRAGKVKADMDGMYSIKSS